MNFKNNKGAALVEMALTLLLLLTIVFGIFEYGRVMYTINTLNHAAREGARRAAVTPHPIDINETVKNSIHFDKAGIAITTSTSTPGSGESVTVTVDLPFHGLTGLVPVPATLRGEATMRYEL